MISGQLRCSSGAVAEHFFPSNFRSILGRIRSDSEVFSGDFSASSVQFRTTSAPCSRCFQVVSGQLRCSSGAVAENFFPSNWRLIFGRIRSDSEAFSGDFSASSVQLQSNFITMFQMFSGGIRAASVQFWCCNRAFFPSNWRLIFG